MKIPLFGRAKNFITIKRIFLYCLYYALFCHFLSFVYSIQQTDFNIDPMHIYIDLFIFTLIVCIIVSIFTIITSDYIIDIISIEIQNTKFWILSMTSVINSIIYVGFSYFVLTSPENPMDLYRALEITIPFFLSNILCLVL